MAIPPSDFQRACLSYKLNWPGSGNDGLTVAQRLDRLQAADVSEARIKALIADAIRQLPPPPPAGMTEARVKQLIAAAILDQHPPIEVVTEKVPLLNEAGDMLLLERGSDDHLLTEAA